MLAPCGCTPGRRTAISSACHVLLLQPTAVAPLKCWWECQSPCCTPNSVSVPFGCRGPLCVVNWVPLPPLCAERVGEASNPGPQSDIRQYMCHKDNLTAVRGHSQITLGTASSPSVSADPTQLEPSPMQQHANPLFRVAVINPTAIHSKVPAVTSFGAHLVLLSETSAVEAVQVSCQKEFRVKNMQVVWSPPVESHAARKTGEPTLRGHALGVAVASSLPLTRTPVPLEPSAVATQRLVEGMLRLGSVQLRVICVYGFPSAYSDAKARNQALMLHV